MEQRSTREQRSASDQNTCPQCDTPHRTGSNASQSVSRLSHASRIDDVLANQSERIIFPHTCAMDTNPYHIHRESSNQMYGRTLSFSEKNTINAGRNEDAIPSIRPIYATDFEKINPLYRTVSLADPEPNNITPYPLPCGLNSSKHTFSQHSESDNSADADKETNLRRERNRIAARKSRQRKLDRISNLEDEKLRLEQRRDMLLQEIQALESTEHPSTTQMSITDQQYENLQTLRLQIISDIRNAYNSGDILSILKHFCDDSTMSGPQNSSAYLRGKDAIVLDYLCTTRLYSEFNQVHLAIDCGGHRSQHLRVHWVFTGKVREACSSMSKEFLNLIERAKGSFVRVEGISNYSFSRDKIIFIHRSVDQAKYLSELVTFIKR